MSYADALLSTGERIELRERQHWFILVWAGRQDGEPDERRIDCLEEALSVLESARTDFATLRSAGALLPPDAQTLERCEKLSTLALSELEKLSTPP